MLITPTYYYPSELKGLNINETDLIDSSQLLNHILGEEWLERENQKFLNQKAKGSKHSLMPILNRHPIDGALRSQTVQSAVYLVSLAECLKELSGMTNIHTYFSRLKSFEGVEPAIFELMVAQSLSKLGFSVNGLQIPNSLGNPVEIVATYNEIKFWFECKSTEQITLVDDFYNQILNKIMKEHDTLEEKGFPLKGLGFFLKTRKPITTQEECNIIKNSLPGIYEYAYSVKRNDKTVIINCPKGSILEWGIYLYSVNEENYINVSSTVMFDGGRVGCSGVRGRVSKSNSGLPTQESSFNKPDHFVSVGTANETRDNIDGVTGDKFRSEVKKKISQQKNLLDTGEEVVIVFDKKVAPSLEESLQTVKRIEQHDRLTILLAEKQDTPRITYKLTPLVKSNSFPNI